MQNGFYYTDPSYRLSLFEATRGELVALLISAQVMDLYRGTPFEHDLRQALVKIARSLPQRVEVPLDVLTGCLAVLPRVQTTYDPEVFRTLVAAVEQSRRLSMVYWTAGRNAVAQERGPVRPGSGGRRRLVPDWPLPPSEGDPALQSPARCARPPRRANHFVRPVDFQARDYMAESFGTIRGDGHYQVALRFTPASAGRIREKQWHPSQIVELQEDGSLILRLQVNDLREIKRWVLFWGPDCEVVEPKELIAMVVADLKSIARSYRKKKAP